ncbi:MAG TPA: hypothetical protein VIV11_32585 [Kofleriaceae bacterium]
MRAAFAALAVVACSAPSPSSPPPLSGRKVTVAPTTPAPRINYRNAELDFPRLPAIARSGKLIVCALEDNDGGRGNPNLRLEIRDRGDRLVEKLVVMTPSELDTLVPDGSNASPMLDERIAAANRKLGELHADHDLITMQDVPISADKLGSTHPARGDSVVITFDTDYKLRVRSDDSRMLATVDGSSWRAPSGKRCAQCEPCDNPAYLAGAYKAPGIDVIVVRIRYQGTDTCWEPPDQLHVVAW